jgi:hypothetical protein
MRKELYEKTLAAAVERLNELRGLQTKTEKEIIETKQMISSLRSVLGKSHEMESGLGLKAACLDVIRVAAKPMTLGEVGQALEKVGFRLSGYSNPMSAIKNTLARMVGKEIKVETIKGKKLYSTDKWMDF